MEIRNEISVNQESNELSGCYSLTPGIHIHFFAKKPAGGILTNEIMAVRRKDEDRRGLFIWQSYQSMILGNQGVEGERKIGPGTKFFTLKSDIKVDNDDKRKIIPV